MSKQPLRTIINIGSVYNRITVISDMGVINGKRTILGRCECGVEKIFNWMNVKSGKSKSCGCLPLEINKKHGLTKHPLYSVWEGIIGRCYNKNHPKYHRYGGRGVSICDEWRNNPKSFYWWAINNGWEKGLSLDKDKLSPNKPGNLYCPEYCCFLTRKENSMYRENSRLIEYNGEKLCVAQWADKYNINYQTFQARLRYGWTIEEIITIPLFKYSKKVAS